MSADPQKFELIDEARPVTCCSGSPVTVPKPCCSQLAPKGERDFTARVIQMPFVIGELKTPIGKVPRVSSELSFEDRFKTFKMRWGIGRMTSSIPPGLYALGTPDAGSEVLVTANYRLTFDALRRALPDHDVWLLVLETFGINVWCAAGKGTFGTEELVRRIEETRLAELVTHRRVIVPQLGAPGVAAHVVRQKSGFKVIYGPVRAADIPAFLSAGRKASEQMRRKTFTAWERFVLIPVELVGALKHAAILALAFFLLSGLGGPSTYLANLMSSGLLAVLALLSAVLGGAVLTPLLLPWLPGRAFSLKSLPLGFLLAAIVIGLFGGDLGEWPARLEAVAWMLLVPALTAFAAMNFTGASTYTSLSGVKKEMRIALPLEISGAALGLALWITGRVLS